MIDHALFPSIKLLLPMHNESSTIKNAISCSYTWSTKTVSRTLPYEKMTHYLPPNTFSPQVKFHLVDCKYNKTRKKYVTFFVKYLRLLINVSNYLHTLYIRGGLFWSNIILLFNYFQISTSLYMSPKRKRCPWSFTKP